MDGELETMQGEVLIVDQRAAAELSSPRCRSVGIGNKLDRPLTPHKVSKLTSDQIDQFMPFPIQLKSCLIEDRWTDAGQGMHKSIGNIKQY